MLDWEIHLSSGHTLLDINFFPTNGPFKGNKMLPETGITEPPENIIFEWKKNHFYFLIYLLPCLCACGGGGGDNSNCKMSYGGDMEK